MMRIIARNAPPARLIFCPKANHNLCHLHDNITAANQVDEIAILDRQILRPDRAETCQSGTDDEVARHKSPYDPTQTAIEKEVSALREEYKLEGDMHDPLAVSPANQDVSHILQLEEERAMRGWNPLGSVRGWTSKRKIVMLRREPYAFRAYELVFPCYGRYKKRGEAIHEHGPKTQKYSFQQLTSSPVWNYVVEHFEYDQRHERSEFLV